MTVAESDLSPPDSAVEELSRILHGIYQDEARRQAKVGDDEVRHPDDYDELPEHTKEYDRVLARFILHRSEPILTIDPRRQCGRVCIDGSRIPAEAVASCVFAGDSVELMMDSFGLTREQVLVACWWLVEEARMQRRKTKGDRHVIEAWDHWANVAFSVLGGHAPGPCPDPPGARAE